MALFNYANREITAKIVYYGPAWSGKTTSLQYIHERIAPAQRGRLLSLATETDRTIFFDLLPLKLGEIRGFKLRFQLYTVPGQPKYNKTRKLVLQGADAIVFVADSQTSRQKDNIGSFQNLQENLKEQGKDLEELPLVYSYNKRDLEDLLSIEELNHDLNLKNLPYFQAIATQGCGVMETLEAISKITLQDIENRLKTSITAGPSERVEEEKFSMTDEELVDLTGGEEPSESALTFSSDELDALDFDLESDGKTLEKRPIGYNNDIPIEEVEIREEDVAHTGTLKESEFFDLKEIEEQALHKLDEFIAGEMEDDSLTFDTFKEDTQFLGSKQSGTSTRATPKIGDLSKNPYIAGNPVGGGEAFIGRADVLRDVLRVLKNPKESGIVLYGQRRIGKTSVLQKLAANLPQQGSYAPVYFDLQDKAAWSLDKVLRNLANETLYKLDIPKIEDDNDDFVTGFKQDFLPHVLSQLLEETALVLLHSCSCLMNLTCWIVPPVNRQSLLFSPIFVI